MDIEFTVYGFSRGAAAARHFIHIIINGFSDLKNFDYTQKLKTKLSDHNIQEIKFSFVGLFDTVSSYNLDGTMGEQSNVQALGLDSLKLGEVIKVFHIAAADEHRKNFGLTTMHSGASKGKEIILPGVHSDIGGSYHDNVVEELVVYNVDVVYMSDQDKIDAKEDIQRLIDKGWFDITDVYHGKEKNKFLIKDQPILDALTSWNEIKVRRSRTGGISNKYARIPFTLMYEECGVDKFNTEDIENNKDVSIEWKMLNDKLKDDFIYRIAHSIKANPSNLSLNEDDLKKLRKKYFHFSAHYNGFLEGMIAPYKPRFDKKTKLRTRNILEG